MQAWLKEVKREPKPPTNGKWEVFMRVTNWWRAEAKEFLQLNASLSGAARSSGWRYVPEQEAMEPIRDGVLGEPGAGKSHGLKGGRRFSAGCFRWEDGVHFQFLAVRNTIAALIPGQTIHSWARIPANAVDARSKANLESVDDRIDTLSFRLSEHAVDPDGRSRYQLAHAAGIIGRLPPASLWQAFPREGPEETSPGCSWWSQASVLRRFLAVAACESQCHFQ